MKTTYIKQLFIALFLLIASAGTASAAQWQLSNGLGAVTPLSFVSGSQDTLRLGIYGNSTPLSAVQVDFYLPEGAILAGDPYAGAITNGHQLTWKQSADDKRWIRVLLHSAADSTMKTPEGELICIPIVWAPNTKSANCHTANSVLSTPKSKIVSTTELQASLAAKVEQKTITVNVSNTEQVADGTTAKSISISVVPDTLQNEVEVTYNTTNKQAPSTIGTYEAYISFAGNTDYKAYADTVLLVLTDKKPVEITTLPTASAIKQGEYLSASLLTGGLVKEGDHAIGGQFVWLDQRIQANTPGKQAFTVKFYPDNATYYATKDTVIEVKVIPTYTVTALAATGGTVTIQGERTDNTYVEGQELILTAKADANWTFTGWSDSLTTAERTDTVRGDKSYIANFEKIMHIVTFQTEGNGKLNVTTADGAIANSASLQQGTVLQVQAIPAENYELTSLTVNNEEMNGDKVVLSKATTIAATFGIKPTANKTVNISTIGNGSLLLYDADGKAVASGSTVLKGTVLKVITLANTGYELDGQATINGQAVTDTYTVGDKDIKAEATFEKKKFTVTTSAKTAAEDITKSTTILTSLEPTTNQFEYGTTFMVTNVTPTVASFDYLLVNGKRMALNQPITVTSNIEIVAVCTKRVDIKKEYILWPHQEFYYNGMSRNFLPFVSQTYAGFSFNVTYIDSVKVAHEKAVDAGKYTVLLTRKEDNLYKAFSETYDEGLVIKKSKVAVTAAPENENGYPTTRPAKGDNGVKIDTTHLAGSIIQYTITPQGKAANNYEGTVYYWASNATKKKLQFGSTLRSTNQGWVRVTNGGLAYNANDKGEVEVEEGFTVTLEAVPAEGFKFVKWSDGDTLRIREYPVTEGVKGVTPVFASKGDLNNIALQSSSYTYDGTTPTLKVNSDDITGFMLSVFTDGSCTYPTELKNAGNYFVRIYRPADSEYQEYSAVVPYTINQAEITEKTLPTASAILVGQTLSESVLEGGSAGIVRGSYAWTDSTRQMNSAGTKKASVTFTPTDANYKPFKIDIDIEVKGTKATEEPTTPDQPTEPTNPEQPVKPEQVPNPIVEQRTDSTAVITWEKVSGASSYKLFLYADKSKKELIATYTFDKDGNLKASNIAFNLQNLTAGKSYYIETVAYDAAGKTLVTKGIELTADPTATEEVLSPMEIYTSRGMIHIQLSQPMGIRILNMAGSLVYDSAASEGRLDIPVASAGIYAVILYERNQLVEVKKVIVR